MRIDVAFTKRDIQPDWKRRICLMIDVLRASSTITLLLNKGVSAVYPVSSIKGAHGLKKNLGCILAGERDSITLPGFDFGNSPAQIRDFDVAGKKVALTTTNGTRIVQKAKDATVLMCTCFLNATASSNAAVQYCQELDTDIAILCAGEKGNFSMDDAACAGRIIELIRESCISRSINLELPDTARACEQLFKSYTHTVDAFKDSFGGQRLIGIGREDDLYYCSQEDLCSIVPVLRAGMYPCFENRI